MQIGFPNNGKPRILLTGAGGQLGNEFSEISSLWPQFNILALGRDVFDIALESRVRDFIDLHAPDVVINCAAYTNVEKAEEDQENAFLINGTAAGWLAEACDKRKSLLIHYSTDYVFDGAEKRPRTETDPVSPLNVYGHSKWMGEKYIHSATHNYFILRVSWLYSTYGHNFFKTMMRLSHEKDELRVVNDQIASPTYARLLAHNTMNLIDQYINRGNNKTGLYHYSESGEASWFDFTTEIVNLNHAKSLLVPVTSGDFPTKAKRPAYSKLNPSLFTQMSGINLPSWQEALKDCYSNFR
jgi:dTDP-4-dehydrorhamnose reductase